LAQLSPTAGDTDRQKEKILFIKLNLLGYKNYQVLIMKMMTKEQFGMKKLEKEMQIECLLDKLGEQFKQVCLMM
jgi:hypothetical protein